jgi:hypothetical protein
MISQGRLWLLAEDSNSTAEEFSDAVETQAQLCEQDSAQRTLLHVATKAGNVGIVKVNVILLISLCHVCSLRNLLNAGQMLT